MYIFLFVCLLARKESFEKHPHCIPIPLVKLGKRQPEEETSNQGKIDRMNRRLRRSPSECIL